MSPSSCFAPSGFRPKAIGRSYLITVPNIDNRLADFSTTIRSIVVSAGKEFNCGARKDRSQKHKSELRGEDHRAFHIRAFDQVSIKNNCIRIYPTRHFLIANMASMPDKMRGAFMTPVRTFLGQPYPLGATWIGNGVNFAIFSEHATGVELCLFDSAEDAKEDVRIRSRAY